MERDGVLAHGMSYFLNESFMVRGEKQDYFIAICNKTGAVSIYNESRNLFLSPYADGPIKFNINPDGSQSIMNLSRFGRSFSILKIPYAFKLMIQELQVMNVQMRIITEENVDQLLSMTYSDNINKLMKSNLDSKDLINEINSSISKKINEPSKYRNINETPEIPEPVQIGNTPESLTPNAPSDSPQYVAPGSPDSPQYAPGSPAYAPGSPAYAPGSPAYDPNSPQYNPNSPAYAPGSPAYDPNSPPYNPETVAPKSTSTQESSTTSSAKEIVINPNILDVEKENKEEETKPVSEASESSENSSNAESGERKIILKSPSSSEVTTSSGIKKITL
jgi:hypothetical protein